MEVEENVDPERAALMIEENSQRTMEINPKMGRFPCCIVWSPLPILSWIFPFIGHVGICREDGVILDFAGPNFVCVDNFAFGAAARYFQVNKEEQCTISPYLSSFSGEEQYQSDDQERNAVSWDVALRKSTQEYQHYTYNILTCNCHSFVANNLNRLGFNSGGWNVVNVATFILFKGRWVSALAVVRSFSPFFIFTLIGLTFGGLTYLKFLGISISVLVAWFLIGTYCFKNLIQL